MAEELPLDGIAHITGGGLYDNVPRILTDDVDVVFDADILPVLPIFKLIQEKGDIDPAEMYRVFNMGIGMVWFVPKDAVEAALGHCAAAGFEAAVVGEVTAGNRKVTVRGLA